MHPISKKTAYLITPFLVALSSIARVWPLHMLYSDNAYLTFYPAIIISALLGGFFAGILATALTCLIVSHFWWVLVNKPFIQTPSDWLVMMLFTLSGTLISAIAEEMRSANERSKNEHQQLEFVLNTSRQGFWNLNLKTQKALRSMLHDKIFGYPTLLPEWTYKTFLSHVHPEDVSQVDKIVKKAIANHLPFEFQCRIYRADDKNMRWISVSGEQITTAKDTHMLGLVQDITERKKIEDANAMLLALMESSDEAIIGKDLKGTIFSWNKAAEKLYGYTENEIINCSVKKLFPADKQDEFDKIMQKIIHGQHIKHKESLSVHKNGHLIPVSITISPIKNAKGGVIGASTTARDITQQKSLEGKLRHLAEHDPLTGLINRPLFEDRIEQGILLAKRQKEMMAVCYLDIDDFSHINDRYGHAEGDLLLCATVERLQTCIRDSDTLARLGGDEFALILLNLKKEQDAIKIVKAIIKQSSKAFNIENINLQVTWSIGIALYPKDGHESLLEKADAAMYDVKNHGKNNFKLFDKGL